MSPKKKKHSNLVMKVSQLLRGTLQGVSVYQVSRECARVLCVIFGYNTSLFGIVDEANITQYNLVRGEKCPGADSDTVVSMAHFFLNAVTHENVRLAKHIVFVIDGCGGKNKSKTVCAYL